MGRTNKMNYSQLVDGFVGNQRIVLMCEMGKRA
jgi:hypothetical protein